MPNGIRTVIFPVTDLAAAKKRFALLLDTEPYMDEPYYVGFNVDGQDIGLDPKGAEKGLTGPTPYVHVPDVRAAIERLVAAGATVAAEPRDVGGGKLVATLTGDQGVVGLIQEARRA